jgi:lia operon protein LiaG
MRFSTNALRALLPMAIGAVLGTIAAAPAAAQGNEPEREQYQVTGEKIAVYDLAGAATLEPATGPTVVVDVQRRGRDAGRLKVEQGVIDGVATLRVIYPDDHVVYDPANSKWNGSSTFDVGNDGTFDDRDGADRAVEVRSSGSGMEAWADLRILVPRGQQLALHLGVGEIRVSNVNGTLRFDGGPTNTTATGTSGSLAVDVRSGTIRVQQAKGDLRLETTSGNIEVNDARDGTVRLASGSGNLAVYGAAVPMIRFTTAAGTVDGVALDADNVNVATGSGGVNLDFDGSPSALTINAGSGSVTVALPSSYTASVDLDTMAGNLRVDFPLRITSQGPDQVAGIIGAGIGQLQVETGSGNINILQH